MTVDNRPEQQKPFSEIIDAMCHEYMSTRSKASRTSGEEGKLLEAKRDKLYQDTVSITAETLVKALSTERPDILGLAVTAMDRAFHDVGIIPRVDLYFVQEVLLSALNITTQSPKQEQK